MTTYTILKLNESELKVVSDDYSAEIELKDHFTFKAPGYQFSPKYKNGLWDGNISLYSGVTKRVPVGILSRIESFAEKSGYDIEYASEELTDRTLTITRDEIESFVKSLDCHTKGKPIEARDYQIECIYESIKNKRLVSKVPTSGGKSFIIYCIMRWLVDQGLRFVLIVPTVTLVNQMYADFIDYSSVNGFDTHETVHKLHGGEAKEFIKPVLVSTWQSLDAMARATSYPTVGKLLNTYDAICIDECHQAKSGSLIKILSICTDIGFRFGTTGTIESAKISQLTIEAHIGPIYTAITTKELIDNGQVSAIKIKAVVAKYTEEDCFMVKDMTYADQEEYVNIHPKRLAFTANLAMASKGTTLILCSKVEKHAIPLYNLLKEKSTRPVYLVVGKVEADIREKIRQAANVEDCIIVASYSTMSTGVSIPNIRNVIFGSSSKSMIRVLQSIGRGLRLHSDKSHMVLIDIVDDLKYKKKLNFALKHFEERLKIYQKEQFPISIIETKL